ncbi:MAG: DUF5914 domain-containing protein [Terracoccus sp.]
MTTLRTTPDAAPIGRPAGRPVNSLRRMPAEPRDHLAGTWRQARPARIRKAFEVAQGRDPGGWHVVGSATDLGTTRSVTRVVMGREVVLWRDENGVLQAGPGSCPHLGALLDDCEVMHGQVYCRWHGLGLAEGVRGDWLTFPAHDDGVLLWVRLPTEGESLGELPVITPRPPMHQSFATVITLRGRCEPQDIIANRLDPWHGTWYHPYAFSDLTVDDGASSDEVLTVDVAFRVSKRWAVPVRAEFTCPDARTIVMTILDGEGAGSVVETHATALGPDDQGKPVTVMTEATIAHSPRKGFQVARAVAGLIRPAVAATQKQLWVDDMAYAERRWLLRDRGETYGA